MVILFVVWFSIGHLSNKQYTETSVSHSIHIHHPFLVLAAHVFVWLVCIWHPYPPSTTPSTFLISRLSLLYLYAYIFKGCSANINLSLSCFVQRLTLMLKINRQPLSYYD